MNNPKLSVIVPTYNEKENIRQMIVDIERVLKDISHEIIVVDDSSPDGTGAIAQKMSLEGHPVRLLTRLEKQGIGAAIRTGYDAAKGDYIASIDADSSFNTQDLLTLYQKIQAGDDLVVADYHADTSLYETPALRTKIKHWFSVRGNRLIRFMTGIPVGTYTANLRMIRKDVWKQLDTRENSNVMLFEMILKTWILGYRISDIPASFRDRVAGKSKMRIGALASNFFLKLFGYWLRYRVSLQSRRGLS